MELYFGAKRSVRWAENIPCDEWLFSGNHEYPQNEIITRIFMHAMALQ